MCFRPKTSKQKYRVLRWSTKSARLCFIYRVEDTLQRISGHTWSGCVFRLGPLKLQDLIHVKDSFTWNWSLLKSNQISQKNWFSTCTCRRHQGQKKRRYCSFLMHSAFGAVFHCCFNNVHHRFSGGFCGWKVKKIKIKKKSTTPSKLCLNLLSAQLCV